MKAAVLSAKEVLKLQDIPIPKIKADEALVKVKACGICGTDIHAYQGDFFPDAMPLVLGHEFSGDIVEVGPQVKHFKVGDRVSVSPDYYCHSCYNCRKGTERFCMDWDSIGTTVDGAFAEYIAVKGEALYHLPDNVSYDEGALIEPSSCVYCGIRQVESYYDKRVLIMGAGSIGLIWLTFLRARNPLELDMMDIVDDKLTYAKKLGADNVYNTKGAKNPYDVIKKKYDVVVDCTGVPKVVESGFNLLDREGTFVFFGVNPTEAKIQVSPYDIYINSYKIVGVYPDLRSFGPILKMLENGIVDLKPVISHRFPLEDFEKGFDLMLNHPADHQKILITMY